MALAQNNNLEYLVLNYNLTGDEGAMSFLNNTTLHVLDLSWNNIDQHQLYVQRVPKYDL